MQIEIAGVNFAVLTEASFLLKKDDPAYQLFGRKDPKENQRIDATIRLVLDKIPCIDKKTKIFDSGQTWSMFRDGDEYCIIFHPPASKHPLWMAKTDPDFKKITVHCSEQITTKRKQKTILSNPVCYPLDQILLMYILAQRSGILVHAAGIEINGHGFIFPGKSGAGKSTLTRQFAGRTRIGLLSDDRMAVRKVDGVLKAFGTPWPGEAKIAVNKSVPLAGMFFIEHGSKNAIKEIKPQAALERLLPVISVPWYDQETFPKILIFCEELISRVPAYEFQFEPTSEAVDAFEAFIAKP
jgi:hypothetical protein